MYKIREKGGRGKYDDEVKISDDDLVDISTPLKIRKKISLFKIEE